MQKLSTICYYRCRCEQISIELAFRACDRRQKQRQRPPFAKHGTAPVAFDSAIGMPLPRYLDGVVGSVG